MAVRFLLRRSLRRTALTALGLLGSPVAMSLPPGFQRIPVVTGLDTPTAFASIGRRLFVTEKNTGKVRLVRPDGTIRRRPYVTVSVSTESERGLLGIAVDPEYPTKPYVYLYYTAGPGALNYGGEPVNRVSRFATVNGVGKHEKILFDGIPSDAGNHNGGDIHFGPDNKLYVAVGDGGLFHDDAQSTNSLRGKILRINSGGTIPPDNPFYATNSGKRRSVYAEGFRNPFRFTFRPSNQALIAADVGEGTWEEVDAVEPGGNYGWNLYEGPCPAANPDCVPASVNYRATIPPVHYYGHTTGSETGNVIIGGVFSNGTNYPGYADDYFYADFAAGWVHVLTMDANNSVTDRRDFDELTCPVAFGLGTDGNVHVADMCDGAIYKYVYHP